MWLFPTSLMKTKNRQKINFKSHQNYIYKPTAVKKHAQTTWKIVCVQTHTQFLVNSFFRERGLFVGVRSHDLIQTIIMECLGPNNG